MGTARSAAFAWPTAFARLSLAARSYRAGRLLLLGALLQMVVISTSAQEALISNLSVDRSLNQPQPSAGVLPPDTPHLGPVQVGLSLHSGAEYIDNINYAQSNPLSDEVLEAGFDASFLWPLSDSSRLNLNAGLGYFWYLNHHDYSRLEVTPNSALAWNLGFPDGTVSLFDQFSFSQDIANAGALTGLPTVPRFENTVGLRVTWLPRKWILQAGYSHDDFFTDSSEFDYLNRSSEYFFARAGRRLADNTQFGVEASGSLTAYWEPIQNDNQSVSIGPFADWQITRAIHASVRGGPALYHFSPQNGAPAQTSELGSYYLGLEADHQLTDYFTHQLNVLRDVQLGLNRGSDFIEQLTVNYSFSFHLTRRTTLSANFTYEHGKQPLESVVSIAPGLSFVVSQTEIFDRFGAGPNLSWKATDHFTARVGYFYWLRQSNLPDRGYVQNTVGLNLIYTF